MRFPQNPKQASRESNGRTKRGSKTRNGKRDGAGVPEGGDGGEVAGGRHGGERDGGEEELHDAEGEPAGRPRHPRQVLHQHARRLLRRVRGRGRRRRHLQRVHHRPAREHLAPPRTERPRYAGEMLAAAALASAYPELWVGTGGAVGVDSARRDDEEEERQRRGRARGRVGFSPRVGAAAVLCARSTEY